MRIRHYVFFFGNEAFQMSISFWWSSIPAIGSVRLRVTTNHLLVVCFGYLFRPEEGPVRVSPTIEGHPAIRHPLRGDGSERDELWLS